MTRLRFILVVLLFSVAALRAQNMCDVVSIQHNPSPAPLYSPDSTMYLVNKPDTAGVFQIYVGNTGDTNLTCISLNYPWSFLRPWSVRNKFMAQWDPTGSFIICGVEKEFYNELLYLPYNIRLGFLESGIWLDVMATTPDGATWYNLAVTEGGFTGPAFTPNGLKCAWAEALDSSNFAVDVFGKWKLRLSDYAVVNGTPAFVTTSDITPAGARWVEPGNFAPDNVSLLISSDIGITNAEGQDQFIVNITNGQVTNLNNSPMIWDEHGVFSPDGTKILFMSSYPYQADTNSYHTLTIKTEFLLMDPNGTNLQQLTHFCDTGYVESGAGIAATGFWGYHDSTIYAQSLQFPDYNDWKIRFYGDCGWSMVSTEEIAPQNTVKLYPNPAQDVLTIKGAFSAGTILHITDPLGKTIRTIPVCQNKTALGVQDLPEGIYFLVIISGNTRSVQKFVHVR